MLWRGRRYELRKPRSNTATVLDWDYEFTDIQDDKVVAYIKTHTDAGYEIHLTIPNTDPIFLETIPEICFELPKIIRSYMRSNRFK